MRHKIRLRKSNERGYKQTKEIGGVSVSKASKTFLKFSPIARRFTALIVKQLSRIQVKSPLWQTYCPTE